MQSATGIAHRLLHIRVERLLHVSQVIRQGCHLLTDAANTVGLGIDRDVQGKVFVNVIFLINDGGARVDHARHSFQITCEHEGGQAIFFVIIDYCHFKVAAQQLLTCRRSDSQSGYHTDDSLLRFHLCFRLADAVEVETCLDVGNGYRRNLDTCAAAQGCEEISPTVILPFKITTFSIGLEEVARHHKGECALVPLAIRVIFFGREFTAQLHAGKRTAERSLLELGILVSE